MGVHDEGRTDSLPSGLSGLRPRLLGGSRLGSNELSVSQNFRFESSRISRLTALDFALLRIVYLRSPLLS